MLLSGLHPSSSDRPVLFRTFRAMLGVTCIAYLTREVNTLTGADKLSNYEEVLRGVRYVNSQPEELNSRSFVVSCTELNGRFTSNKHETTVCSSCRLILV